jgi:26S proteasome regulatory subunit N9
MTFECFGFIFRAALHFLGCTELSTLSVEEQRTKAYLLSIAALLGKDVYNFGELLAHPGNVFFMLRLDTML